MSSLMSSHRPDTRLPARNAAKSTAPAGAPIRSSWPASTAESGASTRLERAVRAPIADNARPFTPITVQRNSACEAAPRWEAHGSLETGCPKVSAHCDTHARARRAAPPAHKVNGDRNSNARLRSTQSDEFCSLKSLTVTFDSTGNVIDDHGSSR